MSDAAELARWREYLGDNLSIEDAFRRLADRPEAPAIPFPPPEERGFRRRTYLIPDPAPVQFVSLDPVPVNSQTAQDLVDQGVERLIQSMGVPPEVYAGTPNGVTTGAAASPTTQELTTAMRAIRDRMPEREFRRELMNEWPVAARTNEGISHFRRAAREIESYGSSPLPRSAFARPVIDAPMIDSSDNWRMRRVTHDDSYTVTDNADGSRTVTAVDRPQQGSRDQTVAISMSVDADGGVTVTDVTTATLDRAVYGRGIVADEISHRALLSVMSTCQRLWLQEYERFFGHELNDDEWDFLEQLRVDLEQACPGELIGSADVMRYLRRYDEYQNPLMRISFMDGRVTSAERVLDSNGVETESVTIQFEVNRNDDVIRETVPVEVAETVNDFTRRRMREEQFDRSFVTPGPPSAPADVPATLTASDPRDVFDVGLLRDLTRQLMMTPEMRAAYEAYHRCVEIRDQMAEMVAQYAPAAADAMRANLDAVDATERARLQHRLTEIEREMGRAGRLPVLTHLVLRRDMQELNMEEVRLWTGSARSDASPEGLSFTWSASMTPPPLYPGVQKAAWSSDEISARQRSPQQRSDQVENLLTRLREILVAKGFDFDLLKFTLNASAPLVNNCRVFVFRVLQTQGGELVELLVVRVLQKINDRGSSDWGYQVTQGEPRRVSRPLRPYVSRESLFREQQAVARQARQSGQAETVSNDRRAEQAAADRAAQERVARARAAAAARHQPPPVQSVEPTVPRPEDFRPGLDL